MPTLSLNIFHAEIYRAISVAVASIEESLNIVDEQIVCCEKND
jgi:hypothetical protein